MSAQPDFKHGARVAASHIGWERLRILKLYGQRCRACHEPADSLHHLIPRGQFGDDIAENLVGLCGDGTTGCHGKVEAWDIAIRARLRETLSMEEVAYILERKSAVWLDHAYPSATIYCAERQNRIVRVIAGICEGCGERVKARSFVSEP